MSDEVVQSGDGTAMLVRVDILDAKTQVGDDVVVTVGWGNLVPRPPPTAAR